MSRSVCPSFAADTSPPFVHWFETVGYHSNAQRSEDSRSAPTKCSRDPRAELGVKQDKKKLSSSSFQPSDHCGNDLNRRHLGREKKKGGLYEMSGGKSFQPWLTLQCQFQFQFNLSNTGQVSANTSDSWYITEGLHPNVNLEDGTGNESRRAKDAAKWREKQKRRERGENSERGERNGLIDG